jgi:hypothetical protein
VVCSLLPDLGKRGVMFGDGLLVATDDVKTARWGRAGSVRRQGGVSY